MTVSSYCGQVHVAHVNGRARGHLEFPGSFCPPSPAAPATNVVTLLDTLVPGYNVGMPRILLLKRMPKRSRVGAYTDGSGS